MNPNPRDQQAALAKLTAFEFSFPQLLTASEVLVGLNDCDPGTGPLPDVCLSFWSRLGDLAESAKEAADEGEVYTVSWAKQQWLDVIVQYRGIILRRVEAGEQLFESEGATAKFREEAAQFRQLLRVIYDEARLAQLESSEVAEW
jgi:hypothetical protein